MVRSWSRVGFFTALIALFATVVVTAASAHPSSSGQAAANTLNIMGFGTNGDDVAKSRFALAQQAIAPDTVSAPNGGFNDQQFLAAIASGNAPDLVYMSRDKVGTYAAKGALQPLTSCFKSQKISAAQYRPAALSQVTYKGKIYGIPEFFDVRTIIADYAVLKANGLSINALNTAHPNTLKQAAVKLFNSSGGKISRIGFDPKLPEFFPLWAKVFGVDIMSKDGLHPH